MSYSSLTGATGSGFVPLSAGITQNCVSGATREVREVAAALSHLWQSLAVRGGNKWELPWLLSWPSATQTAQTAQQDIPPITSILALEPSAVMGSASGSNLHAIPWAGNCPIPCYGATACGWAAGALTFIPLAATAWPAQRWLDPATQPLPRSPPSVPAHSRLHGCLPGSSMARMLRERLFCSWTQVTTQPQKRQCQH